MQYLPIVPELLGDGVHLQLGCQTLAAYWPLPVVQPNGNRTMMSWLFIDMMSM